MTGTRSFRRALQGVLFLSLTIAVGTGATQAQVDDDLFELRREALDSVEDAYTRGDTVALQRMVVTGRSREALAERKAADLARALKGLAAQLEAGTFRSNRPDGARMGRGANRGAKIGGPQLVGIASPFMEPPTNCPAGKVYDFSKGDCVDKPDTSCGSPGSVHDFIDCICDIVAGTWADGICWVDREEDPYEYDPELEELEFEIPECEDC